MTTMHLPSVVIVGGSVSGMTLALLLSQKRLASTITVIEKEKEFEDLTAPQSASYVFRISRGNAEFLLSLFTPKECALIENDICADSDTAQVFILDGKTGHVKETSNPFKMVADGVHKNLIFRRKDLIQLLRQKVSKSNKINVIYDAAMTGLKIGKDNHHIIVTTSNNNNSSIHTNLVFGCDGMHSAVRKALTDIEPLQFQWIRKRMLSTGLELRSFYLNGPINGIPSGNMILVNNIQGQRFLSIFAQKFSKQNPKMLVWFMQRNGSKKQYFERNDSLSTEDGLRLTADKFKSMLKADVPSIDWDTVLTKEAAEEYCKSYSVVFPDASYCTNAAFILPAPAPAAVAVPAAEVALASAPVPLDPTSSTTNVARNRRTSTATATAIATPITAPTTTASVASVSAAAVSVAAVFLVGDSLYSFPSDSGLSVNIALEDVRTLISLIERYHHAHTDKTKDTADTVDRDGYEYKYQYDSDSDSDGDSSNETKQLSGCGSSSGNSQSQSHDYSGSGSSSSSNDGGYMLHLQDIVSSYNTSRSAEASALVELTAKMNPFQYPVIPKDYRFYIWCGKNIMQYVLYTLTPKWVVDFDPPLLFAAYNADRSIHETICRLHVYESYVSVIVSVCLILSLVAVAAVIAL